MEVPMGNLKFIFSGGGTGGHIFPAVAIANALKEKYPSAEFLFVGALGKMEMEKVPLEGYKIIGLPIAGLKRSFSIQNLKVLYLSIKSYFMAKKIIKDFKPSAVIGTGGFASLPICYAASKMNYPVFIWEGNGYAGLTNKIMSKTAKKIFCGFDGMDPYFKYGNWIHSGNPIRKEVIEKVTREEACTFFNLDANKPILFITGGSLGARILNESIYNDINLFQEKGIQLIWQTGQHFKFDGEIPSNVYLKPFLREMNLAYSSADVVISRSGALSCSEIAAAGVPAIFVPSTNVTDDHQTKNAQHICKNGGAVMVSDKDAKYNLVNTAIALLSNKNEQEKMKTALKASARPNATQTIVTEIEKFL
jgi:UDP-N-acetylglucosamine--N-acetylmuramyl-(pentapeptide) pyrophosphoryl-undecaprenol N-acetylglucosamine transferase